MRGTYPTVITCLNIATVTDRDRFKKKLFFSIQLIFFFYKLYKFHRSKHGRRSSNNVSPRQRSRRSQRLPSAEASRTIRSLLHSHRNFGGVQREREENN
ncbi:unnamed protein product [Trichogramma brassicae]|uniref:Uncharacterized protein n=1 Tax=Trichogramma brassicae TaxID=86971 RepID=A0A6H5I0F7_9HYME|nr:unnamed protein product [Trichogramma brassicae]